MEAAVRAQKKHNNFFPKKFKSGSSTLVFPAESSPNISTRISLLPKILLSSAPISKIASGEKIRRHAPSLFFSFFLFFSHSGSRGVASCQG
jgi:hypothetical protein